MAWVPREAKESSVMSKVDRSEVLPLGEYEKIRDPFRARVIREKKARRIALG